MTDGKQNLRDNSTTVARLEEALASEQSTAASMQAVVTELKQQVARLQGQVAVQGHSADRRVEKLEARVGEQSHRMERIDAGREKTTLELRRLEQELKLVKSERDSLREELKRLEGMQSETVAWDDEPEALVHQALSESVELPSITELISNLPEVTEPLPADGFRHDRVDKPAKEEEGEWQEMLSPEDLVKGATGSSKPRAFSRMARWRLIRCDCDVPEEFRLSGQLMTIGRSELADIRIQGNFLSRIHARLLQLDTDFVLEDAGSKNGTIVNGDKIRRQTLEHDDDVWIGSANFRVVDGDRL